MKCCTPKRYRKRGRKLSVAPNFVVSEYTCVGKKLMLSLRQLQALRPAHYSLTFEDNKKNVIGRLCVKAHLLLRNMLCSAVTLADTCKCMDYGVVILNLGKLVCLFIAGQSPPPISLSVLFLKRLCACGPIFCFVFSCTLAYGLLVFENDLLGIDCSQYM